MAASGFNFAHYVKISITTHKSCTCIMFLGVSFNIIKGACSAWPTPFRNFIFSFPPLSIMWVRRGFMAWTFAWHCRQGFPSLDSASCLLCGNKASCNLLGWVCSWMNRSCLPAAPEENVVSVTFLPCFLEIYSFTRHFHSMSNWMSHL